MVVDQLARRGIREQAVLDAMGKVPRERFVPEELAEQAYGDGALSIGSGQTISQPYIVARMTESLGLSDWMREHPEEPPRVLDVGTGSGYQAAVLAEMGARVIGIERDPELAKAAQDRLRAAGYDVEVVVGDGSAGWEPGAPYAGIIVGAATPELPEPLLAQLADGGHIVAPVGSRVHQELTVARRVGDRLEQRWMEPAVFVPLVGQYGFKEG
jgi:protein-L-isoaspartate(D-aspartate) O-methyltransferase